MPRSRSRRGRQNPGRSQTNSPGGVAHPNDRRQTSAEAGEESNTALSTETPNITFTSRTLMAENAENSSTGITTSAKADTASWVHNSMSSNTTAASITSSDASTEPTNSTPSFKTGSPDTMTTNTAFSAKKAHVQKKDPSLATSKGAERPVITSCPVCHDYFDEPKLLPCAHRFCRKCLVTWFESTNGHPSCPICKREIGKDGKSLVKKEDRSETSSKNVDCNDSNCCASRSAKQAEAVKQDKTVSAELSSERGYEAAAWSDNREYAEKCDNQTEDTYFKAENKEWRAESQIPLSSQSHIFRQFSCSVKRNAESKAGDVNSNEETRGASKAESWKPLPSRSTRDPASLARVRRSESLADQLPTDTALAALVSSAKKLRPPHVCNVCQSQKQARDFCLHCSEMLCPGCSLFHSRLSATRYHDVKPVSSLTPELLARNARETCSTHAGQLLELYCRVHGQLLCLVCFAVSHGQCRAVETIADAASRQRQVLENQTQKLTTANSSLDRNSSAIQQHQQDLLDSQQQCRREISSLFHRLSSAVQARNDQLMTQAEQAPIPLKTKLQEQKEETDEVRWLVSANQQFITDSLQSASDVNFLRVSDWLESRAAGLAGDVTVPVTTSTAGQRAVLNVDQYDVLRVEKLLRSLGSVVVVKPEDEKQQEGATSSASSGQTVTKGVVTSKEFDPFKCTQGRSYAVNVKEMGDSKVLLCLANDETLLIYVEDTRCVIAFDTLHPHKNRHIATSRYDVTAMVYLSEGLVVLTTNVTSLILMDVRKNPVSVTYVTVPKVYGAVSRGLENTIVVCPDNAPDTLDIITTKGKVLRTVSLTGFGVTPCHLSRAKDYVIVCDPNTNFLLKVGLETGKTERLSHKDMQNPKHLFVDHMDRLYIADAYDKVRVTNLNDKWNTLNQFVGDGFVVSRDGIIFMTSGCFQSDIVLWYWNKC